MHIAHDRYLCDANEQDFPSFQRTIVIAMGDFTSWYLNKYRRATHLPYYLPS